MRVCAAAFGLVLGCAAAQAQDVPAGVPTLKVTTQLVVVNVSVTDRAGNPLRHLTADQFRVTEEEGVRADIVPQQVVSVDEHDAPDAGGAAVSPALPPGIYTNAPGASATTPVADALTVLLLDSQGTNPAIQQRLLGELKKFARESPPGVRIAIFRTGPDLQLIQGFTSDHAQLAAALDRPEAMPAIHIPNPRPDLEEGSAFDILTRYLARFPGRKNILWFAANFPTEDPFTLGNNVLFGDVNLMDGQALLGERKSHLPVRDLVVYPIDPVAIAAPAMFSAGNERGGGLGAPFAPRNDRNTALAQTAMDELASETGGKAFYNSNDLAGKMLKAIETGSNYYTLAYTPHETRKEGAVRHVTIAVTVPGAHVAYRHEYVAHSPTAADALPDARTTAFQRGSPDATQIVFRTRVVPMAKQPDWSDAKERSAGVGPPLHGALVRYEIDWAADPHGMEALVDANGIRHTKLVVAAVAYDDQGFVVNSVAERDEDALTPEQWVEALKSGMQFHQKLDLPHGTVYLRLVITDEAGHVGATEIALKVEPGPQTLIRR